MNSSSMALTDHCVATAGHCLNEDFKCNNGQCILLAVRCDGDENCNDGSDEYFCSE